MNEEMEKELLTARTEGAKEVLVYLASLYDGVVETDIWYDYFPEDRPEKEEEE